MTITIDGYNFETQGTHLSMIKVVYSRVAEVIRQPYSEEIYLAAVGVDGEFTLSDGSTATVTDYTSHQDNTVSFQLHLN